MIRTVVFDNRWLGKTGIGRYSNELSRFAGPDEVKFIQGSKPTRIRELFKPIIRSRSCRAYYSPGYIARPFFKPQFITIHDLILLEPGMGNIFHKLYFNVFLKHLVTRQKIRLITVSNHSRNQISNWSRVAVQEIDLVPNGVSRAILEASKELTDFARGKTLLFIGNGKPHKRFDLFVEAVNQLRDSYSINIVGSDLDPKNIAKHHHVSVFNNISDETLSQLYLKTNVLVVTSLYEGFCMPVLEGSFLGCKVVHLGVLPTVDEILGNSSFSTGGLIDPVVLANTIQNASSSENRLLESDRANLAERYNWNASREKLRMILNLSTFEAAKWKGLE
jgi:glycosyltransferase involved in cell wall biosynthesis